MKSKKAKTPVMKNKKDKTPVMKNKKAKTPVMKNKKAKTPVMVKEDDTLDRFVTGHIRKTLYGPAKFLSQGQKRFRAMNRDEYINYTNKVQDSGGFDVDGCTGSLPGGIFPIRPTSCEWEPASIAAQFAALKHAEDGGIQVEYKQLVKGNMQAVEGTKYYLTFVAVDPADQMEKIYWAKVWYKPKPNDKLHLVSFEAVPDSNVRAKEMQQDITAILAKISEGAGGSSSVGCSNNLGSIMGHGDETQIIEISLTPEEIQANGFTIFLNEIRSQNPYWEYDEARSVALKKWESFHLQLKVPYLKKAQEEFAAKHLEMDI